MTFLVEFDSYRRSVNFESSLEMYPFKNCRKQVQKIFAAAVMHLYVEMISPEIFWIHCKIVHFGQNLRHIRRSHFIRKFVGKITNFEIKLSELLKMCITSSNTKKKINPGAQINHPTSYPS